MMSASNATAASLPQTNVNYYAEPHGNGAAGLTMAAGGSGFSSSAGTMGPPPPLRPPP